MQPENSASSDDPSAAPEWGDAAPADADPDLPPSETVPKNQTEPLPSASGKGSAKASRRAAETRLRARDVDDATGPAKVSYRRRELSWSDQVLLFLADVGAVWKRVLRVARSQLPRRWQTTLSDQVLTAILLGLFCLLLAIWNPAGRSQPARVEGPADGPEIALEEPAAPNMTEPIGIEAPLPSPKLEVSPEQTLIADIQDQVAEITQTYAAGLIKSVRANFKQGWLTVNLGPQWYDLVRSQQEQMTQDIYKRAQELAFSKLYLLDDDETLVARNPVVGNKMVILKSTASQPL